jgi:signal transduction histidine kinase
VSRSPRRGHARPSGPAQDQVPHWGEASAVSPSSVAEDWSAAASPLSSQRISGQRGAALRNWRVRSKLLASVLASVLAVAVLAGLRVSSAATTAQDSDTVARLATFGLKATELAHFLQLERTQTVRFVASGRKADRGDVDAQRARVDQLVSQYRAAERALGGEMESAVRTQVGLANTKLRDLAQVRTAATTPTETAAAVERSFTEVVTSLIDVGAVIPVAVKDRGLANAYRSFYALSEAKEAASTEQQLLSGVFARKKFRPGEFGRFSALLEKQDGQIEAFNLSGSAAIRGLYSRVVRGQDVDTVSSIEKLAYATDGTGAVSVDPQQWDGVMSGKLQLLRRAEQNVAMEVGSQAAAARSAALRSMWLAIAVAVAAFALSLAVALWVAQSMARRLERLRAATEDIASRELPDIVQRLQGADAATARVDLVDIPVDARDEIGQLTGSFNMVHREAVRIAVEQAGLRRTVSDMFVNLSRRSQSLVDRQLILIEELENQEQTPEQLDNLFRLDHLATRMRRNDENLLVLAGAEMDRPWGEPVPLIDVVRGATAEVEHYRRIELVSVVDLDVSGRAARDIVHLIAELLENATAFSPPQTTVLVSSRVISGRGDVMVEIEDRGVGLSPEMLYDVNRRLAEPPQIDVALSRMMGLFVVGRLAARHSVRVALRPSPSGGTVAHVELPAEAFTQALPMPPSGSAVPVTPEPRSVASGSSFFDDPGASRPTFQLPSGEPAATWDTAVPAGADGLRPDPRLDLRPVDESWDDADLERLDVATQPPLPRRSGSENPTATEARYAAAQPDPEGFSRPVDLPPADPQEANSTTLAIFDQVESEWFRYRSLDPEDTLIGNADMPEGAASSAEGSPQASVQESASTRESAGTRGPQWASVADEGWRVAQSAAAKPEVAVFTEAGLPTRVPMARLVPGAIGPGAASSPEPVRSASPPDPELTRGLLSHFSIGVQRGRHAATAASMAGGLPAHYEQEDA